MHCHCQPYFEIKAEDNGEFFKWLDIDQRQKIDLEIVII